MDSSSPISQADDVEGMADVLKESESRTGKDDSVYFFILKFAGPIMRKTI